MIAVDLFCGAGGLSFGLRRAGIDVAAGFDINEAYSSSYDDNNAPSKFIKSDIRDLHGKDVLSHLRSCPDDDLLLAGCAPCQPFSPHRQAYVISEQAKLLGEFGRLVSELKPKWIFLENVPGILKVKGFSTYRRFCSLLDTLRYKYCTGVVDAKQYGVPQTRRRFVLIASQVVDPTLPTPTHGPGRLPYITVRQAIGHLPPIVAGQSCESISNHRAAQITRINLRRLTNTPADGGGRTSWPDDLRLKCHEGHEGHSDVYGRMKWDAPAPTLTCRCFSISNGRYGHPEQNRAISLREAASLQSFPESFVFTGPSQKSLGEQIGNAVPVMLAEAVGRQMLQLAEAEHAQVKRRLRR